MRLIDADALIKVMTDGIAPSNKDGGFEHPFDILRAIDNAPTVEVDKWVCVKDRLPEKKGDYLCARYVTVNKQFAVQIIRFGGKTKFWAKGITKYFDCTNEIYYWRPLPELPKGE